MARGRSGIGDIGVLLGVIGAVIMIVVGILVIISSVSNQISDYGLSYPIIRFGGEPILYGVLAIIMGVIVLYAQKERKIGSGDALLWGILFIVFGIIGGTLGGLLMIIGGILLVLDYLL